jgi:acyl-CoA thioesterase-1
MNIARIIGSPNLRRIFFATLLIVLANWAYPAKLQAADSAAAESARKTVVVLGDSLAAGYGLDPNEAFPALLQTNIDAAGWNFTMVNAGVSGDTTAGGLRRMDWLLRRKLDVLVLELGGNDGLRGIPISATRTNLQGIIDRARQKYPQVQIVIAGMQMPPNMGDEYNHAFQKIFPDLANANQAALIPFLLEGVGGHPDLNQTDHIHPTAEGDRIVAANVWKVLAPVLEKLSATK